MNKAEYENQLKSLKEKIQEIINVINAQNWLADSARKHIIDIKQAQLQFNNLQHRSEQLTNILFPWWFLPNWINEYLTKMNILMYEWEEENE